MTHLWKKHLAPSAIDPAFGKQWYPGGGIQLFTPKEVSALKHLKRDFGDLGFAGSDLTLIGSDRHFFPDSDVYRDKALDAFLDQLKQQQPELRAQIIAALQPEKAPTDTPVFVFAVRLNEAQYNTIKARIASKTHGEELKGQQFIPVQSVLDGGEFDPYIQTWTYFAIQHFLGWQLVSSHAQRPGRNIWEVNRASGREQMFEVVKATKLGRYHYHESLTEQFTIVRGVATFSLCPVDKSGKQAGPISTQTLTTGGSIIITPFTAHSVEFAAGQTFPAIMLCSGDKSWNPKKPDMTNAQLTQLNFTE